MKDLKALSNKTSLGGAKQGGLNSEIQSKIGHQLKAMYDDVVRQGIPDRFAELIRKLDTVDTQPQTSASDVVAKDDGRD